MAGLVTGWQVLTTQLAIFGMCAQHGAAVLINHIICCRWGLKHHGTPSTRIKTPQSMRVDAQAPPLRLFKKDANCRRDPRVNFRQISPHMLAPSEQPPPAPLAPMGEISIHHSTASMQVR